MASKNFITKDFLIDDGILSVSICRDYIGFHLSARSGDRQANIYWNFDSPEAMQEEIASLIERGWIWKGKDLDRFAISEYGYLHTKEGTQFYDKRLAQVLPEVKAWLKEQFQKPKLEHKSEILIDEFYQTMITQGVAKDELRGLLLKVLEIEGK